MHIELHGHIHTRRSRALLLGLLCTISGLASATDTPVVLVPIERFELDNGMTFLLVDRPESSTIAAGWVVTVGSANDPRGRTGLSHMLEHLMFKGTRTLAAGELDLLYASAGATGVNAVTQLDTTSYFVALPPEKLELWFWLESDRLQDPVFRDLQVEKQVVLEERRLRVESMPTGQFEEKLRAGLWANHPYGRPGLGRPDDLEGLGQQDALEHFKAHYGAGNLTAVLVGPLDSGRVRRLAERYFGRLSKGAIGPGVPLPEPLDEVVSLEATCDCRPQVRALYRAPSLSSTDSPALETLIGLLNGRTGRLHRALVLKQEIAYSAYAQYTPLARGGVLSLIAEAKGDSTPTELLAALDHEIAILLGTPPGEREVQKVRNQLRADAFRRIKEPSKLMMELLLQAGMGEIGYLDRWLIAIETVNAATLQEMARQYLAPEHRILGFVDRSNSADAGDGAVGEAP